jgi:hypothetical protein
MLIHDDQNLSQITENHHKNASIMFFDNIINLTSQINPDSFTNTS